MGLQQLDYVLAIARTGSITAAARQCNIAQPTLSRYLDRLEEELGTPLFIREYKRCIPTPEGEIYLHAAERVQQIMAQTHNSIASLSAPRHTTITVGSSAFASSRVVASAFRDFMRVYPDIQVTIRESDPVTRRRLLREGEVNLAIVSEPTLHCSDTDLTFATMGISTLSALVPVFHPIAQRALQEPETYTAVHISELANTPLILCSRDSAINPVTYQLFRDAGIQPTVIYETDNVPLLQQLAEDGVGISLLVNHNAPRWTSRQMITLPVEPRAVVHNGIAYRRDHLLSDAEKLLVYLIIERHKKDRIEIVYNETTRAIIQEVEERRLWTPGSWNIS